VSVQAPEILVNQVYCSALSCGYSQVDTAHWEPLARLVLEASYEATLLAALCCHLRTARRSQNVPPPPPGTKSTTTSITNNTNTSITNNTNNNNTNKESESEPPEHQVFLTFLGGGVFRNEPSWIARAIGRALARVQHGYIDHTPGLALHLRLKVVICHFRRVNPHMQEGIDRAFSEEMAVYDV
jgi:hypothetical protein